MSETKKVLVLGAGLVARPLVRYLLELPGVSVTVATRTLWKAEKLVEGYDNGIALTLDLRDPAQLPQLIATHDLVISMVPYTYHVQVARECIKHRKNMVTTSYVSEQMWSLDAQAKEAGIIILNELGVDPGIDHMSAMKIIHDVEDKGGKVVSFRSNCGGLPAPEANTNPWGYKFSWSPRGVILAARNAAKFYEDGEVVQIPGEELFKHYEIVDVPGLGKFEGYPNRDATGYKELYGLKYAHTVYRGTLRNLGWCDTLYKVSKLGLLDLEERQGLGEMNWRELINSLLPGELQGGDTKANLAKHLAIEPDSDIMQRFEWLGLLSDQKLPVGDGSLLDNFAEQMLQKCPYQEGERDMVILQHEFIAEYPDHKQRITSTMIDFGIPHGDSSMSRTVGLPPAIGAKLILNGEIELKGVQIPVHKGIYEPALRELAEMNISLEDRFERID